jgi:putative transposase
MISAPDRRETVELIEQALARGASQLKACEVLDISLRTYQRWTREGGVRRDGRAQTTRNTPA